ncbi:MAG: DNA adenine methylase, partial [Caldilinea sp.]
GEGFDFVHQRQLAEEAQRAAQRGVPVVISNHDIPFTREVYAAADQIIHFDVQRNISSDAANRTKTAELLAIYLPNGLSA